MKKSLIISAIALVLNVAIASAKEAAPKKNYSAAKEEITNLLTPSEGVGELDNDVFVRVKVIVTPKHEIVVLKTNAKNKELDGYIKESLNYQKVSSSELKPGLNYEFEVNFKSEL
ncbi:hypothetical protein [Flavobacterium ovatum]|uniref:hypothetical protein n=1 Tax=Flavobacterium ovatum TaxID=1928857 RepID=UPI00344CE109